MKQHFRNVSTIIKLCLSIINMRQLISMGMLATGFALTGCASIVSKSTWPVAIKTDPPGAEVIVTTESGKEVQRGTTPATFKLAAKSGYFAPEYYLVNIKLDGYQTDKSVLKASLNGWYAGNIVCGGLIGMLIVDPMTGAMWKLPKEYTVNLTKLKLPDAASSIALPCKPEVKEQPPKGVAQ